MSTTLTVADVLRKARELYVQAPSHAASWPLHGTYCIVTATFIGADYDLDMAGLADEALFAVVGQELMGWNASSSTETVLAAFDAAIEASS